MSSPAVLKFARVFAAIWLVYDVIDLWQSQMLNNFWFLGVPVHPLYVQGTQVTLILLEALVVIGLWPRCALLAACVVRGAFAAQFPMNDYIYFSIVALILAQGSRDILVLQTVWIYFSSAILKMNPTFLSGGDLFVRQNYLAEVLPLPYPALYRAWIANLSHNAILAWMAVAMELTLAILLFCWWYFPNRRAPLRKIVIALAFAIHGYAALALNVFFFGASIFAQIVIMTSEI